MNIPKPGPDVDANLALHAINPGHLRTYPLLHDIFSGQHQTNRPTRSFLAELVQGNQAHFPNEILRAAQKAIHSIQGVS